MTCIGRRPQIQNVKYLSNHWSDLSQILNGSLFDQTKHSKCLKWRWPPMEDNLRWRMTTNIKNAISKQQLVRFIPNFKHKLMWPNQTLQIDFYLQWKTTSNIKSYIYQKPLVRSSISFKLKCFKRGWPPSDLWVLKRKHSEEISSVAMLSTACSALNMHILVIQLPLPQFDQFHDSSPLACDHWSCVIIYHTPSPLSDHEILKQPLRYIRNPGSVETTGSDNPLPGRVAMLIDLGFIDSDNLENFAIHIS